MKKLLILMLVLGLASTANATLSLRLDTEDLASKEISPSDTITIGIYDDQAGGYVDFICYLDIGMISEGAYTLSNARLGPAAGDYASFSQYVYGDYDEVEMNQGDLVSPDPPVGEIFRIDLHYRHYQGGVSFPGSIDINDATGLVDYAGSPICDPCVYGDTLGGIGSGGMTIEMGSLYEKGVDPSPDPCGVLFTFTVDADCTVSFAGNVSRAGPNGVVKEDPCAAPTVNLGTCEVLGLECYFGMPAPDYAEWESVGKPICWCFERQCHGDADGYPYGKFNYWTASPDLTVMKAAWSKPFPDINGVTVTVEGRVVPVICADWDRLPYGKFDYRVSSPDLTILKKYWSIANGPDPNCLPGNETPPW